MPRVVKSTRSMGFMVSVLFASTGCNLQAVHQARSGSRNALRIRLL